MRSLLLALLYLAVVGCARDPLALDRDLLPLAAEAEVSAAFDEPFVLRIGEVAKIADGIVVVGFRGVVADSRCPREASCVWAGDAELAIGLAPDGGTWTWHSLHTGVEPREAAYGELRLRLIELRPLPSVARPLQRSDYVVELEVTRE